MKYNIVKVSVSNGQARLTIPKEIALRMGFITKDGKEGENKYAIIEGHIGGMVVRSAKIEVEESVLDEKVS
jgi:hypothetical protein